MSGELDLPQAEAFLALLDPEAEAFTFQTFDDSPAKRLELARVLHGTLAGVADSLARLNRLGAGVFVTVNRTDGNGRRAANITGLRALFVDEDSPLARPLALEPSILVMSARGRHPYWRLAPGAPLEAFKPAQKQLISYYCSDAEINDLPRVMRLPGFFHMKSGPKPVTLVGGCGKTYTLDEVLRAHTVEAPPKAAPRGIVARTSAGSREEALEQVVCDVADGRSWAEGDRHKSGKATATHARKLGLPDERLAAIVTSYLVRSGAPEDAPGIITWALENVAPDPDELEPRTLGALALAPDPVTAAEPQTVEWIDVPSDPYPSPIGEAAFYGLAGRFVQLHAPHTEADPVALLLQFLVAFGNSVGRDPFYRVGPTAHRTLENLGLVGESSVGRKGTSFAEVRYLFELAGDAWASDRIVSGLSSGEGLLWEIRDASEAPPGGKRKAKADPGVVDKRLLVVESELGRALKTMQRDGNSLSGTVRELWDAPQRARTMTKNSPCRVTGPHVSIIGHVTKPELLRLLDEVDAMNGLGNRFLWALVRRSQLLPDGGSLSARERQPLADELTSALELAGTVRAMTRNAEAGKLWASVYPDLTADRQGLFGAVTRRAEAHVLRLSMLYALLDGAEIIRKEHLLAALAVWRYCEDSARCIFGSSLGDPEADEILRALAAAPDGLTRSAIRDLFGRNLSAARITRALTALARAGLAHGRRESTGGRPTERWSAGRRP